MEGVFNIAFQFYFPGMVKSRARAQYLNQTIAKGNKKYYKNRRENTPAFTLLLSSHGRQLRKVYGEDFFDRLKKEMMEEAMKKTRILLRFDREFINKVKAEIREDMENELKVELNMMVVA
jgi:hypothetical protein